MQRNLIKKSESRRRHYKKYRQRYIRKASEQRRKASEFIRELKMQRGCEAEGCAIENIGPLLTSITRMAGTVRFRRLPGGDGANSGL